ncbi:hypothetical protein quinque_002664 [Culex quinquefasciatus]
MESVVSMLPSDNPATYCRLCFVEKNLIPLFPEPDRDGSKHSLMHQISQCIGIQIEPEMDGSCSICWRCAVVLEDFQLLRQRSLDHDAIIRNSRKGHAFEIVPVKEEHDEPGLMFVDQFEPTATSSSWVNGIEKGVEVAAAFNNQNSDSNDICYEGVTNNDVPTCHSGPEHLLVEQISLLIGIQIGPAKDGCSSICWRCAVALEDFQLLRQRSLDHDAIIRNNRKANAFEIIAIKNEPVESEVLLVDPAAVQLELMEKPDMARFKCEHCPRFFKYRRSLKEHVEVVHLLVYDSDREVSGDERDSESGSDEPPILGGVEYVGEEILPVEIKTEIEDVQFQEYIQSTSDNLFKCSYCPKSFKHGPSLHFHLKSHYDMLPFVCEFCDARFINEKGKHIHKGRYHYENGVRKPAPPRETFECKECNRNFVHRKYLWQHIRYKHPERCLPDGSDPTLVMLPPTEMPNHEETFENHADDEPLLEIKSEIDDSDSYFPLWD